MARQPPSSEPSLSTPSRTASRGMTVDTSNPNVFSDDYALDSADSVRGLSPSESINRGVGRPTQEHSDSGATTPQEYIPPGLSGNTFGMSRMSSSRPTSTAASSANPQRAVSTHSTIDTRRTLSTSSRFSIPRAQSPYQGPTAPSQPYGQYTQATRASSIISDATIRPTERPFVAAGGPEHPYSMYPQNTVPEEEHDSASPVPIGFPALGTSFQSGSNSSGDETGDIVGSDGHVEQLPPYSRYADNVIAKGDMATLEPPTANIHNEPGSERTLDPAEPVGSDVELTAVGADATAAEMARKEGMSDQKKKKRTCCGFPFWTVMIILGIVVLAAMLGGVIGGVVGNKKGADRASASSAATTTVWLDADPAQTGPSTPPCPKGHYNLALNQSQEINSCVVDDQYEYAWSCMDTADLGINLFEASGGGPPFSVVFDDYSVRPQRFQYGPQPPDFNGSSFQLGPFVDKDDDDLGVALFFSVLFDKLSIFPEHALAPPDPNKRSVPAPQLAPRGGQGTGWSGYLATGDRPWYCFWNSTINEFWIFLDQNADGSSAASSSSATITSGYAMATSMPSSEGTSASSGTQATTIEPSATNPYPTYPTDQAYWTGSVAKRGAPGSTNFPKMAKMVQKRKPDNNVPPYCQQMQVLDNWQIVPIPGIPTIGIEEREYAVAAATQGSKRAIRRRDSDTVQQLGSNCICEWFSTP